MPRFAIPWLSEQSPRRLLVGMALLLAWGFAAGCGRADKQADMRARGSSAAAEFRHGAASQNAPDSGGSAGIPARASELAGVPRERVAREGVPPEGVSPEAIPPEIETVASMLLGSGAEVVAFGDLARNGHEQALVVNRIVATAGVNTVLSGRVMPESPAVPFTRATVIERDGARWVEVLRCDEYLKNPKGFLSGTPLAAVTGWSVQLHQQDEGAGKNAREESGKHDREDGRVQELIFSPLPAQGVTAMPVAVRWNSRVNRYQTFDRAQQQFQGEAASLEMPTSKLK